MSRKSVVYGLGIAVVLIGVASACLVLLVRNEPAAYSRATVPPGEEREMHSKAFVEGLFGLMNALNCPEGSPEIDWDAEFTDQQINSYFDEDFISSGTSAKLLPEGISQPRVAIEPDKLRVMFRYGSGAWSTIISINLHVWMAGKEPNAVAMELQGFRAGSLPISAQSLLERISDVLRGDHIEVSWYRLNGNPVAVLHFQSDPQHSSVQLKRLELQQGRIVLHGTSTDGSGLGAMLPTSLQHAFAEPGRVLARK